MGRARADGWAKKFGRRLSDNGGAQQLKTLTPCWKVGTRGWDGHGVSGAPRLALTGAGPWTLKDGAAIGRQETRLDCWVASSSLRQNFVPHDPSKARCLACMSLKRATSEEG